MVLFLGSGKRASDLGLGNKNSNTGGSEHTYPCVPSVIGDERTCPVCFDESQGVEERNYDHKLRKLCGVEVVGLADEMEGVGKGRVVKQNV